jgi:recombinational DNA repair protein RecT
MHWSEFIMMIGIIIITTYISINVINDIKKFLSKWTVLRINIYNDLITDSNTKEELVIDNENLNKEVNQLTSDLFQARN